MSASNPPLITNPWSLSVSDILEHLTINIDEGLSQSDVTERRKKYGVNRLRETKKKSPWLILIEQLKSLIVLLLAVAAVLSAVFHEWMDAGAIAAVIIINTMIGFVMELKAVRSMESLRRIDRITARVRRDGRVQEIAARDLVPGDVVVLEGGDIVSADMRLARISKLQVDESVLTGESMPVGKQITPVDKDAPLAERFSMLYKGTALTRGSAEALVVATGMKTELGQISALVEEAEEKATPLERRLDRLGKNLVWVTLVIMAVIAGAGIIRGKEILLMIETAIALAVAAIPEGLPIVATIALSRGMLRMARRNALVNRLSAVETLGGTTVICTDKTGTLTENKMTVTQILLQSGRIIIERDKEPNKTTIMRDGESIDPPDEAILMKALEVGVLCNNASLSDNEVEPGKASGDPLEISLLEVARRAGINYKRVNEDHPEEREEAFDSDIKMMATYNRDGGRYRVAVKGAPEAVLDACSSFFITDGIEELAAEKRRWWDEQNEQMAREGLRVLAVAVKHVDSIETEPYKDLTMVGLLGMVDPPRQDVRKAIEACRRAGVRVVMVTGDQAKTAASIAAAVGLTDKGDEEVINGREIRRKEELSQIERDRFLKCSIFARVSPRQKLDLIDLHQEAGSVVAMTGDGVNDAPALKKADIGVAMGQRGTQVACEASDMVLLDDAFSTIVLAVEQGRIIFGNIMKFVIYLLSCNVSEIMTVFVASLVNAPLPILPLQILFLNLVTDVFPALALGIGKGDPRVMEYKPRDPSQPILSFGGWLAIMGYGALITCSVLASFAGAIFLLDLSGTGAVTISFLTLAFAQLWHIFNMREKGSRIWANEVTRNAYVWGALSLCTVLLGMAVYVPFFSRVLKVTPPGVKGWLLVFSMSLIPLIVGQCLKISRQK
ncbi:MAG: HAD-IC family P-type ATPase [Sedimentisphaerales bacterium]|nr:HAD-IC family P-type ATPase [Sedimentisphaerales bacterium]